jgi:hypothetical protein
MPRTMTCYSFSVFQFFTFSYFSSVYSVLTELAYGCIATHCKTAGRNLRNALQPKRVFRTFLRRSEVLARSRRFITGSPPVAFNPPKNGRRCFKNRRRRWRTMRTTWYVRARQVSTGNELTAYCSHRYSKAEHPERANRRKRPRCAAVALACLACCLFCSPQPAACIFLHAT